MTKKKGIVKAFNSKEQTTIKLMRALKVSRVTNR